MGVNTMYGLAIFNALVKHYTLAGEFGFFELGDYLKRRMSNYSKSEKY